MLCRRSVQRLGTNETIVEREIFLDGGLSAIVCQVGHSCAASDGDAVENFNVAHVLGLVFAGRIDILTSDKRLMPRPRFERLWSARLLCVPHCVGQRLDFRLGIFVATERVEVGPFGCGDDDVDVCPWFEDAVGDLLVQAKTHHFFSIVYCCFHSFEPSSLTKTDSHIIQFGPGLHTGFIAAPVYGHGWITAKIFDHLLDRDSP